MNIRDAFSGVSRVLLETAPVIYYLEANPRYVAVLDAFFRLRAERGIALVTTPVTLAECLVHPLRRGLTSLAESYERLIITGEGVEFSAIGQAEAREAAYLRARYGLRLADAMQAATARVQGCQAVLTNDADMRRVPDLRVILVDDLQP